MKCPKCGAPLQSIDLEGGNAVLSCPSCAGAFYDQSLLAVEVVLSRVVETKLECPKCGGRMRTGSVYEGKLELDQCEACSGVWLDAGEVAKLRALSGVEGLLKPQAKKVTHEELVAIAQASLARIKGGRTSDDPMSGKDLRDSATMENPDASRAPTVAVDGVVYKHFQTAIAEVTCALGEFTWQVRVGEQARCRDFIAPPQLLSNEVSGRDSAWSQGRYLEASEVWSAFQLEGSPSLMNWKVAPAQPNKWEDAFSSMLRTFGVAVALALVIGFGKGALSSSKEVLRTGFFYNRAEPEKSKVSPKFTLEGGPSNVEIQTASTLSNHWAYITMALINADTDEAHDFGREISFYSGRDSDGPWSEGSPNDTVVVPKVPAGRYYLRVEPEDGDAQEFSYNIVIKRDVPQFTPVMLAILLLFLPFVFVWWRRYSFEVSRWQESDHPWVASGDDDDDDD